MRKAGTTKRTQADSKTALDVSRIESILFEGEKQRVLIVHHRRILKKTVECERWRAANEHRYPFIRILIAEAIIDRLN